MKSVKEFISFYFMHIKSFLEQDLLPNMLHLALKFQENKEQVCNGHIQLIVHFWPFITAEY